MTTVKQATSGIDFSDRHTYVGASEVAAAVGLHPYMTPLDLYLEKVGDKERPDLSNNERVHFGNVLEDVVCDEFARRTGIDVRRDRRDFQHAELPFFRGHIDRKVTGEKAGMEAKTADKFMGKQFGAEETDNIPMYYLTQCLGYLSLTGWDRWHLGVLIGGNEFRSYTIESSAKANKILEEKLALFWQRVEHRNPPEPITSGDVDKLYPSACIASIDIANQVEELREVRATMKGLMSQKEELEIDIKKFMKTTDVLLDPEHGKPMITWAGSAIKNLNKTAVEKELGDRLSEFQKTTTTRRFVVK